MNKTIAEYGTKYECYECGESKPLEAFGALKSVHGLSVCVCSYCASLKEKSDK